jgi:hypothetical protein
MTGGRGERDEGARRPGEGDMLKIDSRENEGWLGLYALVVVYGIAMVLLLVALTRLLAPGAP